MLSKVSGDELRRIMGEQRLIVDLEFNHALQALPLLVPKAVDRRRIVEFLKTVPARLSLRFDQQVTLRTIIALLEGSFHAYRPLKDDTGKGNAPSEVEVDAAPVTKPQKTGPTVWPKRKPHRT